MPYFEDQKDVAVLRTIARVHADYAWKLLSKDYDGPGDEVREDLAADERRAMAWALLAINANLALIVEGLHNLASSSVAGDIDYLTEAVRELRSAAPRATETNGEVVQLPVREPRA